MCYFFLTRIHGMLDWSRVVDDRMILKSFSIFEKRFYRYFYRKKKISPKMCTNAYKITHRKEIMFMKKHNIKCLYPYKIVTRYFLISLAYSHQLNSK